jgi:hypothetical protein
MYERAMKKRRETALRHKQKAGIAVIVIFIIAMISMFAPETIPGPARAADTSVPLRPWPPSSADKSPFYFWRNKPSMGTRPTDRRDLRNCLSINEATIC